MTEVPPWETSPANAEASAGVEATARLPNFGMALFGLAVSPLRTLRWCVRHFVITAGLAILVVVMTLGWQIATMGTRDVKVLEGEYFLDGLKQDLEVVYGSTRQVPRTLTGDIKEGGCGMQSRDLTSYYYVADPRVEVLPDASIRLRAYPQIGSGETRIVTVTFRIEGGDGTYERIDK